MIRTYENFEELADKMTDGLGILHAANCPHDHGGDCISWQRGVLDFAAWLDHIGCKVRVSDKAENFYEFMRKEFEKKSA